MSTFSGLFGGGGGAGPYTAPHRGYKSGFYYSIAQTIDASTSDQQTLIAGTMYYTPFYVHSDIAISALTFANGGTSDNGKNVRVGVYSNNQGMPDALIVAASPIALTGAVAAREVVASANLPRGWHWFALQVETSSSIRTITNPGNDAGWSINTLLQPAAGVANVTLPRSVASTYGAFPSTAPAPTAAGFTLFCGLKVA